MFDLLICNGEVVIPKVGIIRTDIGIKDQKISALISPNEQVSTNEVIDARGSYVFPGIIDPHTHIGYGSDKDFETETMSALLGGVTTVLSFIRKNNDYLLMLDELIEKAERDSYIDFSLHLGITTEEHLKKIADYREFGIPSFKLFMNYRGKEGEKHGIFDINDGFMFELFVELAKLDDGIIAVHTENIEVVHRRLQQIKNLGRDDLRAWENARPSFVEAENLFRAMYFATKTSCPLYIPHISSKEALGIYQMFDHTKHTFYAETCPHYLSHTSDDSNLGTLGKVNPPLRYSDDQEALWSGILGGLIDTVGSDHVARKREKKQGSIWKANAGFPGIGTLFPYLFEEGHKKRGLSLQRLAEITSYNQAKIFNLYPKKGTIQVGTDADLIIIGQHSDRVVSHKLMKSHADYSLYEGWPLSGWPHTVILRGRVVVKEGEIIGKQGSGLFIKR